MNYHRNYVPAQRQERILEYIRQHGSCQIKTLSEWLGVSEATIRRDLDEMSSLGNLERTHGGAIYKKEGTSFEHRYEEKMTLMENEKRRIARQAVKLVSPGDTIFLDSGTTTFFLAAGLGRIPNLTVFTYDLMVAYYAELHSTSSLIVTGGIRRMGYNNVLLGDQVSDFLRGLCVDKTFLGADAVDVEYGVTNSNYPEAGIKAKAVDCAGEVFLLADHSKFGKRALARVCGLDRIDVLITDDGVGKDCLDELKTKVKKLILCDALTGEAVNAAGGEQIS